MLGLIGLLACGGSSSRAEPDATPPIDAAAEIDAAPLGDILDELRAIPGLTVEERSTMHEGYRFFLLGYEQPVDHANPGGATFRQRMTLLHRDYTAPVVAHNSGYYVSTRGNRSQVTIVVDGNQLSMEHRYFSPSRPDPADWTKLTIEQAARDQHRITQALKQRIYKDSKWLTTGASKGGMTSLFHRRFFPDDVDATVAYVAPIDYPEDAIQSPTNRYIVFLENVGTDATCRQRLEDFQNIMLARRDAMKTRMQQAAAFTILGEDRALEFAVEELPFIFWQYGSQARCASIPSSSASDDVVFAFFDDTVGAASYGDGSVTAYLPYYHQSATQLSYPISDESYLVGLMYPNQNTARSYIPPSIPTPPSDDGVAMEDVQSWIASSGARLLLIYGQNDPWTAGAVSLGDATDSFKLVVPNGNHGASIVGLTEPDRTTALEAVRRWAGLPAASATLRSKLSTERTLEQDEFEQRRGLR